MLVLTIKRSSESLLFRKPKSNDYKQKYFQMTILNFLFCFIGVSLKVGVDSASFAADLQCGIRKECLFEDTKLAATAEQTFSVEKNLEETSCEECSSLCEETDGILYFLYVLTLKGKG